MRATWLFVATSVVWLSFNCPSTSAKRLLVFPRQATTFLPTTSSPSPTSIQKTAGDASSTTSPLASNSGNLVSSVSTADFNSALTTASSSSSSSSIQGTGSSAAVSTVIGAMASPIPKGSLNVTNTNGTMIEGLPIRPEITPGLSIAGALMLLTGIFYTLVGIKTKWLHISLSSAYLVSLAITVLIIYVMHPPISNALQGVYVMAATISGLLLGGGSIIFKDVTEGFGCFLGGFSLSMWFLTLRSGGLIDGVAGKVIFISCFTVGGFALYLSHHTRPYGLIGSTSFAGATVTVLGIDCFSRAGLKEFWVYIWSMYL